MIRPAVVVVNWNGEAFIERCLLSLRAQTLPPQEVVIVDNGSEDGSPALVAERFPEFTLLQMGRNLGFAAATNRGVEATSSGLVALLNNDAWAEPTWLEALSSSSSEYPDYSLFASRVLLDGSGGLLDTAGDGYSVAGFSFKRGWQKPCAETFCRKEEVFSPSACAAMYTREVWEQTGGFDESYFVFAEDVDLGFRARLLGHRCLYVPEAIVHHVCRGTAKAIAVRLFCRNEVATLIKDMPLQVILSYLPHIAAYQLLSAGSHVLRGQGAAFVQGRVAALRALPSLLARRRSIQSSAQVGWREVAERLEKRWWRTFWGLSSTWRRLARVSHRAS